MDFKTFFGYFLRGFMFEFCVFTGERMEREINMIWNLYLRKIQDLSDVHPVHLVRD